MRLTQRVVGPAAAIVPIVAVDLYNAYYLIERKRVETHRSALDYSRYAAWEIQRLLVGLRGVMQAVAISPLLRELALCEKFASDILAQSPQLASLAVGDQAGLVRCGPGSQTGITVADRPISRRR